MKLARLIINICEKILKEAQEDAYVYLVLFNDAKKNNRVLVAPGLRGEDAVTAIENSTGRKVKRMSLYGEYRNGVFTKAVGGEIPPRP